MRVEGTERNERGGHSEAAAVLAFLLFLGFGCVRSVFIHMEEGEKDTVVSLPAPQATRAPSVEDVLCQATPQGGMSSLLTS